MQVNQLSETDAADNWDLPLATIAEIVDYCEQNGDLIRAEAKEEKLYLQTHGLQTAR